MYKYTLEVWILEELLHRLEAASPTHPHKSEKRCFYIKKNVCVMGVQGVLHGAWASQGGGSTPKKGSTFSHSVFRLIRAGSINQLNNNFTTLTSVRSINGPSGSRDAILSKSPCRVHSSMKVVKSSKSVERRSGAMASYTPQSPMKHHYCKVPLLHFFMLDQYSPRLGECWAVHP